MHTPIRTGRRYATRAARQDERVRPEIARIDWPVRTERLVVRPVTVADVDAMWRYRRLPEANHWLSAAPTDLDDYREHAVDPERMAKTLVVEREGELIGDLMLSVSSPYAQIEVVADAERTQAELGWCLAPEHTGHGYAKEAVRELFRLCFEELGLRRVVAGCFADNEPSWRLMERMGMRRERHAVRESLHRSGQWLDSYEYALLREEWTAAT
jgi:RimJ/RimL family protein N-acetyltransferase